MDRNSVSEEVGLSNKYHDMTSLGHHLDSFVF